MKKLYTFISCFLCITFALAQKEINTEFASKMNFAFQPLEKDRVPYGLLKDQATFSVRELNKGIYVLKIYINGQVESHLIAVE